MMRRSPSTTQRWQPAWVATAMLAVMGWCASAAAEPSQIRVVWTDDPAHQAVVSWTSTSAVPGQVVFDGAANEVIGEYPNRVESAPAEVPGEGRFAQHAVLGSLSPNTIVHFRIVDAGSESRDYWFRSAPDDITPFSLLYGGDSRSDSKMRRVMNARLRQLAQDDPSIVALAHGGDYVVTGGNWPRWNEWLDDWQETIAEDGHVLPIIPARGNHEGNGELFNVVFGYPGRADARGDWYVTRIGQDFALVTLDSNVSHSGDQRQWLNATLMDLQDTRWIVPNYHRPAYPAVKSPGDALTHWVPLFEQYNVDFVMESDGHVLKRTVPIRADQPDPTGVVYLGEGGLGVPQRTPDLKRWYLQAPGMAMSAHHVQVLRVTRDKIFYSAVDGEGEIIDRYEFEPRRLGHAGETTTTIRAMPVGQPPPPAPPTPAPMQCSTALSSTSASGGALIALLVVALCHRRRRRLALALTGVVALSGCIAEPCLLDLPGTTPKILAIGDSVMHWNSPICASIPDAVAGRMGGTLQNEARIGARLTTVDHPIREQYRAGDWDWVLVDGGGNDLHGCGCDTTCGNEMRTLAAADGTAGEMENLLETILDDGARVVLLGGYHVLDRALFGFAGCNPTFDELEDRYRQLATVYPDVHFVDMSEAVRPEDPGRYEIDGIHPSVSGSSAIANLVIAAIDEAD